MTPPQARTLAALGLQRWRLRSGASPGRTATPRQDAATHASVAPEPAGDPAAGGAQARLRVHAPGLVPPPAQTVEAAVWRQVLAWLAMSEQDVAFLPAGGPDVIVLPSPAAWAGAEGKRALWLALKAIAAGKG